jgi:hypothetical protein
VEGVWQGVVFLHTDGAADEKGNNGLTAGPNRIEKGPDGNFYIGQIGAGNLWTYNDTMQGLQRLRVKSKDEVSSDFNEIRAVRVVEGGFELEFLKPVPSDSISLDDIKVAQWTYFPTENYGGKDEATILLRPKSLTFDTSGLRAILVINGLKDDSPEYVVTDFSGQKSNDNTGWVVHVSFDPKKNGKSLLYTKEFWYTLHKKIGGKEVGEGDVIVQTKGEQLQQTYQGLCLACHIERDGGWGAPNLKGILGRKQTVLRDGKEVEITVDRNYLINAVLNPDAEKSLPFKDLVMPPLGLSREAVTDLVDYITKP